MRLKIRRTMPGWAAVPPVFRSQPKKAARFPSEPAKATTARALSAPRRAVGSEAGGRVQRIPAQQSPTDPDHAANLKWARMEACTSPKGRRI